MSDVVETTNNRLLERLYWQPEKPTLREFHCGVLYNGHDMIIMQDRKLPDVYYTVLGSKDVDTWIPINGPKITHRYFQIMF